jgi:uncharacterized membrane protein (UPF0127 family)
MRTLQIKTKDRILSDKILLARSAYRRLIGLLNHKELRSGEGLLLDPCNQVHSLFMQFTIDAVFLDSENRILRIHRLKPWRVSPLVFKAKRVLELPEGQAKEWQLEPGMKLEVDRD